MKYRILLFIFFIVLTMSCSAQEVDLVDRIDIPYRIEEWRYIVFDDYIVCNESDRVIIIDINTGKIIKQYENYVFVKWDISQEFFLMRNRVDICGDAIGIRIDETNISKIEANDIIGKKILTSTDPSTKFKVYSIDSSSYNQIITLGKFSNIMISPYNTYEENYSKNKDGSFFVPCDPYSSGGYYKIWFNDDLTEIESFEFFEIENVGITLKQLKEDYFITAYKSEETPGGYDEELFYPVILNSSSEIVKEFPDMVLIVPMNNIYGAPFQITPDKTKFVYYYIEDLNSGKAGFKVMDIKY